MSKHDNEQLKNDPSVNVQAQCFMHWKQGDDFNGCLEATGGDVAKAFGLWSEGFQAAVYRCQRMAETLKNAKVECDADTHMISIRGTDATSNDALRKLIEAEDLSFDEGAYEYMADEAEDAEELKNAEKYGLDDDDTACDCSST